MFRARIRWAGDEPIPPIVKRAKHEGFAIIKNGLRGQFALVIDIADSKSILATESKNHLQILLIEVLFQGVLTRLQNNLIQLRQT